jgi:hypothetical protein
MMSSNTFLAFAAARGDGLHPRLRELLERTAANPSAVLTTRHDGMLQAGPNPASEMGVDTHVTPFSGRGNVTAAAPLRTNLRR